MTMYINNKPIKLPIGGFQKQSLIDYPGNISSVIFTQGCNFRCIYCHNMDLVLPEKIRKSKSYDPRGIIDYVYTNHQLLDAVVITGGEPTLHGSLPEFIYRIKNMGLKVKLDTNGTNPEMLKTLIAKKMVDYVAMDIKAPLNTGSYRQLAGKNFTSGLMKKIIISVDLLEKGSVEHEFRTTLLNHYHTVDSINEIAKSISGNLYLQNFRQPPGLKRDDLEPFKNYDQLESSYHRSASVFIR